MNQEEKQGSKVDQLKANIKRLMKKRWAVPALYLTLAAVVLTGFIWLTTTSEDLSQEDYTEDSEFDVSESGEGHEEDDAVPVAVQNEVFEMPVLDESEVSVVGNFYSNEDSAEEQVEALIQYNNYYYQNKGVDLASDNGESFDVSAAMSGTVVKAEEDALFGQVVHVEHDDDILSIYQSLEGVLVEEGQTVKQGDVMARAGRNLFNSEAGVHLHFEIRKNDVPVNPLEYMEQPLTSLPEVDEDQASGSEDAPEAPVDHLEG
ncbi:M23 family metallopeptidase [Alteribacter natronophilus]|uniref:M23 family metallopeptidase n=1 Tax=Alteribacter natronophilus TaxID=2583810 RepID=UPI00110E1769|nr:M23 family metallopeptidase [Alteribacter natronophilus]TMW72187.1 M23 family metallopeptidase [Alteribacter natronophilus]